MIRLRKHGSNTTPRREGSLLAPVAAYLNARGFRLQHSELPFYEYRIDLYAFSQNPVSTVAVELKLYHWRRAFRQALVYQLCADLVYIAMPARSIGPIDTNLLDHYGIGLIVVEEDGRCSIALPARQSTEVRSYYKRSFVSILREHVSDGNRSTASLTANGQPFRKGLRRKNDRVV